VRRRSGLSTCARRHRRFRPHVRELDAYKPVARLFANLYAPLGKPFTLVRQTYAEWFASNGVKRG
jgi:hypothetical protein